MCIPCSRHCLAIRQINLSPILRKWVDRAECCGFNQRKFSRSRISFESNGLINRDISILRFELADVGVIHIDSVGVGNAPPSHCAFRVFLSSSCKGMNSGIVVESVHQLNPAIKPVLGGFTGCRYRLLVSTVSGKFNGTRC